MKGKRMLVLSVLLVLVMTAVFAVPTFAAPKLNKTELTLIAGNKVRLKVTGTETKPEWSSSDKTIAAVSQNGVVKGRKAGTVTIKAKVDGKTLKCKLVVFASSDSGKDTSGQETVLTFKQEGWYVARLQAQVYDKEQKTYSYVYSDDCAIHDKATITIDTSKYEIARVGYQIWYYGWDN